MNIDVAAQCSTFAGTARLWGTINAASVGPEAAIRDWNRNGRVDMILTRTNEFIHRTEVYEFDGLDSSGRARFVVPYQLPLYLSPFCSSFPCPPYVMAFGDINNNGLLDLICKVPYDTIRIFEQTDSLSYPTIHRFRRYTSGAYYPQGEVRDFDLTNQNKLLLNIEDAHSLYRVASRDSILQLAWRDSSLTNGNYTINYGRYAVGDFDDDGRIEFAGGNEFPNGPGHSNDAFMFVYENTQPNAFRLVFSDTIPGVFNLFVHGSRGDSDKNGRQEFWLGGYTYTTRTIHRFYMYEAIGDNRYDSVVVVNLWLPYLGIGGNGSIAFGDVDGDSTREIAISTGDYVILMKPVAVRQFRIISCFAVSSRQGELTIYDIDGDGVGEIVVSSEFSSRTWLYKYSASTSVTPSTPTKPSEVSLLRVYPNPFNPTLRITYSVSHRTKCTLRLYDMLGKRILTLFEGMKEAGTYSTELDATVQNLASGTYLLRMEAAGTVRSSKVVLAR
jgi:hypothetical protein